MELDRIDLPEGAEVITSAHPAGGPHLQVKFPNGYGASVIKHAGSYGVELAVLAFEEATGESRLVYDTPVTYDVIGWIESPDELARYLRAIAGLGQRYEYTDSDSDIRFVWKQDASAGKIHLYWVVDGRTESEPFEVITVYDYAAGKVTIGTYDEFKAECEEWLSEHNSNDLNAYWVDSRRS